MNQGVINCQEGCLVGGVRIWEVVIVMGGSLLWWWRVVSVVGGRYCGGEGCYCGRGSLLWW